MPDKKHVVLEIPMDRLIKLHPELEGAEFLAFQGGSLWFYPSQPTTPQEGGE